MSSLIEIIFQPQVRSQERNKIEVLQTDGYSDFVFWNPGPQQRMMRENLGRRNEVF